MPTKNGVDDFARCLIDSIPPNLTEGRKHFLMNNPGILRGFLAGLVPEGTSRIQVVATIFLDATRGKKTKNCLVRGWNHCEIGRRLIKTEKQPYSRSCYVSVCSMGELDGCVWKFAEFARALPGVAQEVDPKKLGRSLIELHYTLTLPQFEKLKERMECGENTDLRGFLSLLFFVETGRPKEPVSVVYASIYPSSPPSIFRGRGKVHEIARLGDNVPCNGGYRFFIPNLDASKLS